MKIHIYEDPGHAWAKVKRSDLINLGIENKISSYSYEKGDHVYLEEDCDLTLLLKSLPAAPVFIEHFTNNQSKIRSYKSFEPRKNVLTTAPGRV